MCSFLFFKQKTAYEMRISDWSSDVCSSDLKYRARFGKAPYRLSTLGYDVVLLTVRLARDWKPGTAFPEPRLRDDSGFSGIDGAFRSEEHTSELQSLMRISYAVFCLKKKKSKKNKQIQQDHRRRRERSIGIERTQTLSHSIHRTKI